MKRYLKIYWLCVRNSLIREMNFKLNFLLWIAVEMLWFVAQLAFIEVLYGQVDSIAGWSKYQVVALVGAHQIIAQLFQAFFFMNLANLPELVRTGRLDLFLTLPVDAQFAISTRQFGLDSLLNALVGVGIVTFAMIKLGFVPTLAQLALCGGAIVLGIAVHYAIMFNLACISFWSTRANFVHGYFHLFMVARYPESVFRGIFRFILTWLLPVLWVSNVPAIILTRPLESPWPGLLSLAAGTAIVLAGSRAFWLYALRRYSSASS